MNVVSLITIRFKAISYARSDAAQQHIRSTGGIAAKIAGEASGKLPKRQQQMPFGIADAGRMEC